MSSKGRFAEQDSNDDAWVGVSLDGVDRDTNTPIASKFLIKEKNSNSTNIHLGFDEDGNEIFREEH